MIDRHNRWALAALAILPISLYPAASPAALPVGSGGSESCFSAATNAFTDSDPAAGDGYYYLIRGNNSCGTGSYGSASDSTPRVTTTCP